MSNQTPYIGSKISLISKLDIRYEGILYSVNTAESTIALVKGKYILESSNFYHLFSALSGNWGPSSLQSGPRSRWRLWAHYLQGFWHQGSDGLRDAQGIFVTKQFLWCLIYSLKPSEAFLTIRPLCPCRTDPSLPNPPPLLVRTLPTVPRLPRFLRTRLQELVVWWTSQEEVHRDSLCAAAISPSDPVSSRYLKYFAQFGPLISSWKLRGSPWAR